MAWFYSSSIRGFILDTAWTGPIPDDARAITDEYREELLAGQAQGGVIVADGEGRPVLQPYVPPTDEQRLEAWRETRALSRMNFCVATMQAGILTGAEAKAAARGEWPATFAAALAEMTPEQQDIAEIEWASAATVRRNHPLIARLAAAAEPQLTDAQVDQLFGWEG